MQPLDPLHAEGLAWDEAVHALAALSHNLVLTVAPQRILAGGGVVGGQPFLIPRLRPALIESLAGYGAAPDIAGAGRVS